MRNGIYGVIAIVMLAGPAWAQGDAKAVIEKAIAAAGGKERLDKFPASKNKFTGDMSIMGLDIKFEGTSVQAPGQFKLEMVADVMGQKLNVTQIVDNGKVKTKQSLGGTELPSQPSEAEMDELRFSVVGQEIAQLTPLLAKPKKFSLKTEAEENVGDKLALVVTVTTKVDEKGDKTKDVKLFFDKETYLLVKTSRQGLAPGDPEGKPVLQESILSDYKLVDGIKVAMKTTNYIAGNKFMTITSSEHKLLEKVEKKEFLLDE